MNSSRNLWRARSLALRLTLEHAHRLAHELAHAEPAMMPCEYCNKGRTVAPDDETAA
jgi:hypothetical protein